MASTLFGQEKKKRSIRENLNPASKCSAMFFSQNIHANDKSSVKPTRICVASNLRTEIKYLEKHIFRNNSFHYALQPPSLELHTQPENQPTTNSKHSRTKLCAASSRFNPHGSPQFSYPQTLSWHCMDHTPTSYTSCSPRSKHGLTRSHLR